MTKRTVATKWQRFTETARGYDPDPMGQIYQYDYPSGAIEIYKEPAGRYATAQFMVDIYFEDGSAERHSAPTLSKAKALGLSVLRSRTNPAPLMNVRRNYLRTNWLHNLSGEEVRRGIARGELDITHAPIGNGYYTVTLFTPGQGEAYKYVEAKWFVRGEDEWYDLANDLRNGRVDPSTASVFLGPSRWDKNEREKATREAAASKGFSISEKYHYFNNPKFRRNSEQKYVVTVDSGFSQTGYEGDRCYSFEATEKRLSQILAAEWSSFHGQHADFLNDLRTKGKARLGSSWSFIEAHAKKSNPARRQNSKSRR
jgi:hypothetical protein